MTRPRCYRGAQTKIPLYILVQSLGLHLRVLEITPAWGVVRTTTPLALPLWSSDTRSMPIKVSGIRKDAQEGHSACSLAEAETAEPAGPPLLLSIRAGVRCVSSNQRQSCHTSRSLAAHRFFCAPGGGRDASLRCPERRPRWRAGAHAFDGPDFEHAGRPSQPRQERTALTINVGYLNQFFSFSVLAMNTLSVPNACRRPHKASLLPPCFPLLPDIIINADLFSDEPEILSGGLGFTNIIGEGVEREAARQTGSGTRARNPSLRSRCCAPVRIPSRACRALLSRRRNQQHQPGGRDCRKRHVARERDLLQRAAPQQPRADLGHPAADVHDRVRMVEGRRAPWWCMSCSRRQSQRSCQPGSTPISQACLCLAPCVSLT